MKAALLRLETQRMTCCAASCVMLLALSVSASGLEVAHEPPASMTQHRCYTCHADREALAGPAFVDVAARYRGQKNAVDTIAREIRAGVRGGGPWHMPPHPEVSAADARAMARYIVSLQDLNAGNDATTPKPPAR